MNEGKLNDDYLENKIILDSAPGAEVLIEGKRYNYFAGTGYYELNKNPEILRSAAEALTQYGISSSSSRSSYGTTKLILELEKEAAMFFDAEDSVYLPSGFLTPSAAIQALALKNNFDLIFIDEVTHYSNQFAAQLTGKQVIRFSHLSSDDLNGKLRKNLKGNQVPLIITDGIFPVYGKIAPIGAYKNIIDKYNGKLWIDEAHSLGILGNNGKGTTEYFGINSENIYFGGTLSKAFGGFGGIIPGKKVFIDEIKKGDLFNGATPAPSPAIAASLAGIKFVEVHPEKRNRLYSNAKLLKDGLKQIGIEVEDSVVPIAAWSFGNRNEMQKFVYELFKSGYIVQLINYVGSGEDGAVRIVVFETHTQEQIKGLLEQIKKII
ncbi:MAG: pyridoxal phosphate-dependent aminotransferase family protein [Bacteroidota bacterium]